MAVVPIKFRCYACNQLLGVSRSKIGGVVSCPKCSAELVVPDPDEIAPVQEHDHDHDHEPAESGQSGAMAPSMFLPPDQDRAIGAMDTGVALDFLDIRPEDIRVEPGVRTDTPAYHRPATVIMPPPEQPEPPQTTPTTVAPRPDRTEPAYEPPLVPTPTQVAVEPPIRTQPVDLPFIAPIAVETPAPRIPRREPAPLRSRDLIVPRSVVASWSLFVLLALVAAFFAGLFAGHYVWRVH